MLVVSSVDSGGKEFSVVVGDVFVVVGCGASYDHGGDWL